MKITQLIILVLIIACHSEKTSDISKNINNSEDADVLSYLALGDSYTIGESVPEAKRWPVQLSDSLNKMGIRVSQPKIIARTGWTTDELSTALQKMEITGSFDLVSLLIGVNDQYRERPVEDYRTELKKLLNTARLFAGGDTSRVFVISIPDWGVTPFAADRNRKKIAREIDQYNQVKREETLKRHMLFIDITDISRDAKHDPSLIAGDGLHPSGKMYNRWIVRIIPRLITQLRNGSHAR